MIHIDEVDYLTGTRHGRTHHIKEQERKRWKQDHIVIALSPIRVYKDANIYMLYNRQERKKKKRNKRNENPGKQN